jgi:hypothetical protein
VEIVNPSQLLPMSTHSRASLSRRHRNDRDDRHPTEHVPPPELNPSSDLDGVILDVPDSHWFIETGTSTQHPGACVHYEATRGRGILLKGTDTENIQPDLRWRYYFVTPDQDNGLEFQTAFECAPRYFRLHRLRTLLADRRRGRLSQHDLEALRQRLTQMYGL